MARDACELDPSIRWLVVDELVELAHLNTVVDQGAGDLARELAVHGAGELEAGGDEGCKGEEGECEGCCELHVEGGW